MLLNLVSNVSELYYTSSIPKPINRTQHKDGSGTGPYTRRNKPFPEKLNKLLNSVKDTVLHQLGTSDRTRHNDEGKYSWIDKFTQRIESDAYLLGTSNASTPQFFPKMPSKYASI
ncbi:hypothetical protein NQ314_005653 [Rhamnusium bicolor]|uniref:Uncharacterized protein n=1 Tax=Rhamnusium bicolor TaxID=1586634 RepID=A0AAV8ZEW7_9CUCU|nr:hypothetical protein NQ314_005653 [Rhamnusium bicolor]